MICHALKQERTAVKMSAGANFLWGHPKASDDALVERSVRVKVAQLAAKSKAQVRHVLGGRIALGWTLKSAQINAHQMGG